MPSGNMLPLCSFPIAMGIGNIMISVGLSWELTLQLEEDAVRRSAYKL